MVEERQSKERSEVEHPPK
jgi:hypothetical protein